MKSNTQQQLDLLLKSSDAHVALNDIPDLLTGVVAAPRFNDGGNGPANSWIRMIAEQPSLDLVQHLNSMLKNKLALFDQESGPRANCSNRVSLLREEMSKNSLDGYIIPLADEFHGEYVPKRAQRLAWLTGFTGSAGAAIVLKGKACVFIDGRYTLQVRRQVDCNIFDVVNISEMSLERWVASELKEGENLGFDPWIHTIRGVERLKSVADECKASLVPISENLIDIIWPDQPGAPLSPVETHNTKYTGEKSESKREKIAHILKRLNQDALILSSPSSIAWILNIRGGDVPYTPYTLSFGVLHANAKMELFIDLKKIRPTVYKLLQNDTVLHSIDMFDATLKKLGNQCKFIRLDKNTAAEKIRQILETTRTTLTFDDDPCILLKSRKNDTQVAGFRAAHFRDGLALTKFLSWLHREAPKGNITEISAANKLEAYRRQDKLFRSLSFPSISGFGANGAIIHYRATKDSNLTLEKNNLYLLDSGGQYLDGTTDVTRTLAIGKPSDEMRHNFTRVLKGHIALAMAKFPRGTTGSQLDVLARYALWQAGLDFEHGTGHGVGHYLDVHEGPQRISKTPSRIPLETGMIISNEPGYYKAGAYGIRLENLVVVKLLQKDENPMQDILEFETLTLVPIDLSLIERSLLELDEINWLNKYHSRVFNAHNKFLSSKDRVWLKNATLPL